MGETGTGKTTLIRLLLALVKPQEGEISIYSSETSNICPTSSTSQTSFSSLSPLHRCNFVYVPQGNTLLSGTLRENLQLGSPQATDHQMREALQMACADFVAQAQRIAIARALLRPGSIMLLDEATSALDVETEKKVLENILSDHRRTVIFVTHRPAVVNYCDQVVTIGQ